MSRSCRAPLGFVVLLLSLVVPAAFLPGCGKDKTTGPGVDGIEVPAAWAGIWSVHSVDRNCGSDIVVDDSTNEETLCAGENFLFGEDFGVDVNCSGTVTDTEINLSCTGTETFEGVVFSYTFTIQATRSGDSFSGTSHTEITSAGETILCNDEVVSATRIGPAPEPCISSSAMRLPREEIWDSLLPR